MGAGQAGPGWVAGRQLAGKVVPAETTSSPRESEAGVEGEERGGAECLAWLYLATLLAPQQQDLLLLSLQLLDPDKSKAPHWCLHLKCRGLSPRGDRGEVRSSTWVPAPSRSLQRTHRGRQ